MKRSPMKPRTTPLRSSGRIAPTPRKGAAALRRTRWMKARNAQRKAKEWARAYGSEPRVLWIQSLPCVGCGAMPSENAHTVSGGKGRKADAATIAPLCGEDQNGCHTKYDQHRAPFDTALARDAVKLHAAVTDARWTRLSEVSR